MAGQGARVPADLTELTDLERVLDAGGAHLDVSSTPSCGPDALPVYAIAVGNPSHDVPGAGFFGGVHGLERIGAQVVIAWLQALVQRLRWDTTLHRQLEHVRLVFMPLVNPGGMLRNMRANPAGVDLMRNAPVDASDRVPVLLGGHRIGPVLPWFRGRSGMPMEPESAAVCSLVERELHPRPFSLALDCHSGFGLSDRLWFPFAHSRRPIAHLAQVHALQEAFAQSHPHHPYIVEPQSSQYLAHGDLWDHLYMRSGAAFGRTFLPLTLEMGSWLWVKKNPSQLFSRAGMFNPVQAHRQHRVLRRHLPLLDFLVRAAIAADRWLPVGAARQEQHRAALRRWYHGR
ncbi:MAG: M14 family metallopeptidase [Ramlibacter sp.]